MWVGQKLELNLELWSTGYSFGDQLFVLPEISGGYLMQADSTTVKLSESRAGVQWHDMDDGTGSVVGDNEAIVFYVGTALSF